MAKPKMTFWCVNGCGKKVKGLNVTQYSYRDCKDNKRFVCLSCGVFFSLDELERYGNNVNRVRRRNIPISYLPLNEGDWDW